MIPGEMLIQDGEITINAGRATRSVSVANRGDRPIQIGSHFHFFETNEALAFDRDQARGYPAEHSGRHRGALRARSVADRGAGRVRRRARRLRLQRPRSWDHSDGTHADAPRLCGDVSGRPPATGSVSPTPSLIDRDRERCDRPTATKSSSAAAR